MGIPGDETERRARLRQDERELTDLTYGDAGDQGRQPTDMGTDFLSHNRITSLRRQLARVTDIGTGEPAHSYRGHHAADVDPAGVPTSQQPYSRRFPLGSDTQSLMRCLHRRRQPIRVGVVA